MLRTKTLRAAMLLPATLAIALVSHPLAASADLAQNAVLNAILTGFAAQEGKATAVTTASASADDLVYAVYQAAQNGANLAELVDGALTTITVNNKAVTRADKDKIVGRIVEAAIIGAGAQADATKIQAILAKLPLINAASTKALTAAGKELALAKVLRATSGLGAAIASSSEALITNTPTAAGTTADAKRTAFLLGVAKALAFKPQTEDPALAGATAATAKGTYFPVLDGVEVTVVGEPAFVEGAPSTIIGPTSNIINFIDAELDHYADATAKQTAAIALATGVATIPSVAGSIIGGYAKDLKASSAVGAGDAAINNFLKTTVVPNAKFAKVLGEVVAESFRQLDGATSAQQYADDGAALAAATAVAASRASIVAGTIRASAGSAVSVIDQVLAIATKPIAQTGYAAFAGTAAVGNSASAADIFSEVLNKYTPTTQATEITKFEAIANAVIKGVANANPDAADAVAQKIFAVTRTGTGISANPFTENSVAGQTARKTLAAALAKGAATNYTAAGAAVAGVVHASLALDGPVLFGGNGTFTTPAAEADYAAQIAATAIKAAAKAAQSIAYKVTNEAALRFLYSFPGSTTTVDTLAVAIANNPLATSASASIAAGASLSDTQNAGVITRDIINIAANNSKALAIANTVAVQVDVEAIGLIAKEVGSLFQNSGATGASKLPKVTSLAALATSLGKAIEAKPFVLWQNRVDEMGELAAQMIDVAVSKGVSDAKTIAAIGSAILKTASAKFLANTGNAVADLGDVARYVAGSLAQAIASSSLSGSLKDALLTANIADKKSLFYLLSVTGKTAANKASIAAAFANILSVKTGAGVYGTYTGTYSGGGTTGPDGSPTTTTDANGTTSQSTYEKGATYENTTGPIVGPETRVKNI